MKSRKKEDIVGRSIERSESNGQICVLNSVTTKIDNLFTTIKGKTPIPPPALAVSEGVIP
jgi:hypothetical protein